MPGAHAGAHLAAFLPRVAASGCAQRIARPKICVARLSGILQSNVRRLLVKSGVRTLYNILFTIFFALCAPYYFVRMRRRGNWQKGFPERFGKYNTKLKQAITNRNTLWMHAVSVGEVNVCTQLIRALELRLPQQRAAPTPGASAP